jgi:hypothetical protein
VWPDLNWWQAEVMIRRRARNSRGCCVCCEGSKVRGSSCNPPGRLEAELKRGAIEENNSTTRSTAVLGTSAEIHGVAASSDDAANWWVRGVEEATCGINERTGRLRSITRT